MKEWCLQHPWMTFFILIFFIYTFFTKIFSIFEGKKSFMENLIDKGGIKMTKGNGNSNSSNNNTGIKREIINEQRGSQSVPPPSSKSPSPPPKQK